MLNVTELDNAYRSQLQAALARERAAWHTIPWQTRAMLAWMKTHTGARLGAEDTARAWLPDSGCAARSAHRACSAAALRGRRLPGDLRERTAAHAAVKVPAGAPRTDSENRAGAARRHGTPSRGPRGKPVAPLRFCQVLATSQHRGRTARLPLSRREGAAEEANHSRKTIEAALARRGPARP